ncbi:PEP/pyruvate-binding domain-containing protein [Nonomuraea insulae]|uniref:PEP/pyruvate-binding domain-containing protein n=1 Tax=Nonomuraea insulae TaxID=1616787 RepID=A0ABW1CUK6_9ACTN
MTPIILGTKAQTLRRLRGRLTTAEVADQLTITVGQWRTDRQDCLDALQRTFPGQHVIVRSSAPGEDSPDYSCAGVYTSVPQVDVDSSDAVASAVAAVIASFTHRHGPDVYHFEILIQPMLADVTCSGVAFTRDLVTRAPYLVINYDESGRTDTVTSGTGTIPRIARIHHQARTADLQPPLDQVAATVAELTHLLDRSALDVEFAISRGRLYVLQVRPLPGGERDHRANDARVAEEIARVKATLRLRGRPIHGLFGRHSLYSNMADWNPAEMIGAHPRPLALSLYQKLITREVWREARHRLGYHHPAPHQLMVTLAGRPYVDLRADFNSYLPATLDEALCHKLIDFYLARLAAAPETHDKVEFRICPSALDFDFPQHATALADAGLTASEIDQLRTSLLQLTTNVVHDRDGQLAAMHQRIGQLAARRQQLTASSYDPLSLADALLYDARHLGTMPFAVAVRGTFIATALWRSLRTTGVITQAQHDEFLTGIHTVATEFTTDLAHCQQGGLPLKEFLARYGHLRPGTYDITVPSYAAAPDLYLGSAHTTPARRSLATPGKLPPTTMRDIDWHLARTGFDFTAQTLLDFVRDMQTRREAYKFQFTATISRVLELFTAFGRQHDMDTDCLSYLTVEDLLGCAHSSVTSEDIDRLRALAHARRHTHTAQSLLHLPDVIIEEADADIITNRHLPNFITTRKITAPAVQLARPQLAKNLDLAGQIVLTEHADPGFEFLFCRGIAGLITQYGGAASHMAIRCTETDTPAAIGCGHDTFAHLTHARNITLDCAQQRITA